MPSPFPNPSAAARLFAILHTLRERAGRPTFDAIGKRLVGPQPGARNVASQIFNGGKLPTKTQLDAIMDMFQLSPEERRQLVVCLDRAYALPDDPAVAPAAPPRIDAGQEQLVTTYYDETSGFYTALQAAATSATRLVRATYIRQNPPTRYANPTATNYFDRMIDWAGESGCTVNRVIGVPSRDGRPDKDFTDWLVEHHERVKKINAYEARVVEWPVKSDAINMAIIDDEKLFLTFSGINDSILHGCSVTSARLAERFNHYFYQLWIPAVRLREYVASIPA